MKNYINNLKVGYLSLGCKVNAYETASIQNQLASYGAVNVGFKEYADVYLINTCSVTNIADRKSRQMLHQAKKRNPNSIVVATGCYIQEFHEKHLEDAGIDLMIGNRRKNQVAELLMQYLEAKEQGLVPQKLFVSLEQGEEAFEEMSFSALTEKVRADLKIQDGCNQFCSYCIIPYTRGRIASRKPEAVLAEIKRLVEEGYQEFVLTGIHLSSYGFEHATTAEQRALRMENGVIPLLELTKDIAAIDGVRRIRFGSLEPRIITEEFVSALAKIPQVCPHFHLSLQSGADVTLKAMNRKYTTAKYLACCDILRKYFTKPSITTDVIVGFPQETEEAFAESMQFMETVGFAQLHVFPFSRRQKTAADRMEGQLTEDVKKARQRQMELTGQRVAEGYRQQLCGMEEELLVEDLLTLEGKRYAVGHTRRYVAVALPVEERSVEINQCIPVRITDKKLDGYVIAR